MIQKNILFVFIAFSFNCNSQTLKTITTIESSYHNCLDEGDDMRGCSIEYYEQADSLLNVVYRKLRLKFNDQDQSKLKKEQLEWLKHRDKYFEKIYSQTKKEGNFIEGSSDFDMIVIDKKADFVLERVKLLIKRVQTIK